MQKNGVYMPSVATTGVNIIESWISTTILDLQELSKDRTGLITDTLAGATYVIPNKVAQLAGQCVSWLGNKVVRVCDEMVQSQCNPEHYQHLYNSATSIYQSTENKINQVVQNGTSWIAPNAAKTKMLPGNEGQKPFSIVDLAAPSLFLGICANKTYDNGTKSLSSLWKLVTFQRTEIVTYTTAIPNPKSPLTMKKIVYHTTCSLMVDTLMQGAFTALWLAGAYFGHRGISDAFECVGETSENAFMKANIIAIAATTFTRLAYR